MVLTNSWCHAVFCWPVVILMVLVREEIQVHRSKAPEGTVGAENNGVVSIYNENCDASACISMLVSENLKAVKFYCSKLICCVHHFLVKNQ